MLTPQAWQNLWPAEMGARQAEHQCEALVAGNAGVAFSDVRAQTNATIQPTNVHPSKTFSTMMAAALRFLAAMIEGKKYSTTPAMKNIPPSIARFYPHQRSLATPVRLRNISTSSLTWAWRREWPLAYEALINAVNSGCGSSGFDLNSGWNWHPRK